MAKGYWIGHIDVQNAEAYKNYVAANGVAFAKFGGRFLVRGGRFETVEGKTRSRNVVIEFPSYEAARACWSSALAAICCDSVAASVASACAISSAVCFSCRRRAASLCCTCEPAPSAVKE